MQEAGAPLKAFGAGLMSSFTELQFAVESADAHHVPFDLETVMRTGYEIDKFQRAYFVLPSFEALRDALQNADIASIVKRWKDCAAARSQASRSSTLSRKITAAAQDRRSSRHLTARFSSLLKHGFPREWSGSRVGLPLTCRYLPAYYVLTYE